MWTVLPAIGRFYGVVGWAERPTRAHMRSIGAAIASLAATLGIGLVIASVSSPTVKIPGSLVTFDVVAFGCGLLVYAGSFLRLGGSSRPPAHVAPLEPSSPHELPRATPDEEPFPEQIRKAFDLENIRSVEVTLCGDHLVSLGQVIVCRSRNARCLDKRVHRSSGPRKNVP